MFKHSVFAEFFCAARYPNIPRDCKERQIFEAFTVCLDEDEDESDGICDLVERYEMKMKMISSKASNSFLVQQSFLQMIRMIFLSLPLAKRTVWSDNFFLALVAMLILMLLLFKVTSATLRVKVSLLSTS